MRRPYIGVAVIALVLVAAVVVRSSRHTEVAGMGAAMPVAGAPVVGDCLVQPVSRVGVLTSQANQPVFPHFVLGSCSGRHDGEVIAVVDHRFAVPPDARTAFDPYEQWCDPALSTWTGVPPDGHDDGWVLEYRAQKTVSLQFAGPDPRQLAAGQQWVACIAVPQVTDALGGTSTPYLGSIRNGYTMSPPPPAFSSCWQQPQSGYDPLLAFDCTSAHRVEVVGHRIVGKVDGGAPIASAEERRSCLAFAADVTGMGDPTAGGRLLIGVQIAAVADQDPSSGLDAWCVISAGAGHQLVGPLLGLREGSVPLR